MIKYRINKEAAFVSILALLIFMAESTGFDFYSHAVAYYFYDVDIYHKYLFFDHVVFPRYFLLSYFYEFISRIGIPIGYLSLFLIIYPIYKCVVNIDANSTDGFNFQDSFIILALLLLTFFYSGLSVTLIWFISYYKCKDDKLLLGGFFHPVGVIIYFFGLLFISKKAMLKYSVFLMISILFLFINTELAYFTSSINNNVKYNVNFSNLYDLLLFSFEKKKNEMLFLLFFIVSLSFFKNRALKMLFYFVNVKIKKGLFNFLCVFCVVSIFILMLGKSTFINSIFSFDFNDVMYVAWFDFGDKNLFNIENPFTLNNFRYN